MRLHLSLSHSFHDRNALHMREFGANDAVMFGVYAEYTHDLY
jgi:hypothetical protein